MCDDLGIGELGCYGQTLIKTPNIDKMATEGMRFTQHYSGSAVCAPTRDVLMTGMHTGHTHIRANWRKGDYQEPIKDEAFTIAEMFKNAGYVTGAIGKWGIGGPGTTGDPLNQGFDHFFGYLGQVQAHNYYPDYLWRNTEQVSLDNLSVNNDYSHDFMTDEAIWFIDQNHNKPFFLYIPFTIPHTKFQVPDLGEYATMDNWTENQKTQAAMISRMDSDVGKILQKLKDYNIDENTLVIFTSDNGAHGAGNTIALFDGNSVYRGKKRDLYEGGIRAPHIAWWPSIIKPSTVSDHVSAFWDLFPTCCELVGQPIPENLDGISYLPTLWPDKPGQHAQDKHECLYWEIHENNKRAQAVRMGNWKGVRTNVKNNMDGYIQLYNLETDVSETTDVSLQYPEITEKIRFLMLTQREEHPHWNFKFPIDIKIADIQLSGYNDRAKVSVENKLQLVVDIIPSNTYDKSIEFEILPVNGNEIAEINKLGELVVGNEIGFVDVVVKSVDNPEIKSVFRVEITDGLILETKHPVYTSSTSVNVEGEIVFGDGALETGFVWGLSENPTINNCSIVANLNNNIFTASISGLIPGQNYYLRSYAKTSEKIEYGNEFTMQTQSVDLVELYENLVLYYPFDNDIVDHSNNSNDPGLINGAPINSGDAIYGQSLTFDGSDDYLQTHQGLLDPSQKPFTFCVWIKPTDDLTKRVIFQQESVEGSGRSILYLDEGKFTSYLGGKSNSSIGSYQVGDWTHVAITGNPIDGTIQFFVNGKAENKIEGINLEKNIGEINIGRHKIGSNENRKWYGQMDEVMVFEKALNEFEVKEIMNSHVYQEKSEAKIKSFIVNDYIPANIYHDQGVINFTLDDNMDIKSVKTSVIPSKMATVTPSSELNVDFTNCNIYNVTSYNGIIKSYDVNGNISTSINSTETYNKSFKLFPNPAKEYIHVKLSDNLELNEGSKIEVKVFDIIGKEYHLDYQRFLFSEREFKIPLNLKKGLYLVILYVEELILGKSKLYIL